MPSHYLILGAGVIGLTTALELSSRFPSSTITIIARFLPGDHHATYTSPWAGANWLSVATDNGRQESWDAITYRKFKELSQRVKETGVCSMPITAIYDSVIEEAGVLSQATGKIWYENLVDGIRMLEENELPEGAKFGCDLKTFVVDTQVYLPWLQGEVKRQGIEIRRGMFDSIDELFTAFPSATAYFNCTGLGAYSLKGVEDKSVYPTRGQIMLVESPKTPMTRMYFRSPQRVNKDTTYVFPRGPHNGVVLGGVRLDNVWNGDVDLEFAEDIKRRCCALAPELGKPEDLKVIYHGVGLRPSRKGGARLEREKFGEHLVIHNYGAGGAGYQASWGMAKEAVDLLQKGSRL
ncbi:putative D-amino acid oxidase, partial [Aureobasidium melanogenum]|uniref:Putative D-amino acid oxidase n=1 Tax=Aureobasidium melanogenum (strain CBS 110374) TaxID=1043003 RepID=A0A074W9M3_AURM1